MLKYKTRKVSPSRPCSAGRLASRLSSTPHHLQQSMTLAFLENQLTSALTLQSAAEYRHWLLIYARFLVSEGTPQRRSLRTVAVEERFQHVCVCFPPQALRIVSENSARSCWVPSTNQPPRRGSPARW